MSLHMLSVEFQPHLSAAAELSLVKSSRTSFMLTCPSPSHLWGGAATWSTGSWEEQEQLVMFLRLYPPVPERRVSLPLCSGVGSQSRNCFP